MTAIPKARHIWQASDDQTAIKVVDGIVEVVSEGNWKLFSPTSQARKSGSKTTTTTVAVGTQ